MKHSNISVFIPHVGCPQMCSFCNQRAISGSQKAPTGEEVRAVCREAVKAVKNKENCEIAFFGGSFTAVLEEYRTELLESVQEFILNDGIKGIRISTRPDCIDRDILEQLKKYNVTSIELGCQSLDDDVLKKNLRGHDSLCVEKSAGLIKEYGFELGLQMMTGLYGSTPEKDRQTAQKIIELKPDTVRIYPVVVLKGTELARYYEQGVYKLYSIDEMVTLCSELMMMFSENDIRIIKCGLHASEIVEGDMVAGYYHPAFRELCEGRIFRTNIENSLKNYCGKSFTVSVNEKDISKALGHKRSNIQYFNEKGISLKFLRDSQIKTDGFIITTDDAKKGSN